MKNQLDKLITFETAKLAKEKGFIEPVISHYRGNNIINNGLAYNFNNPKEQALWNIELTSAPTQSAILNWLWIKHKIWVEITLWGDGIGFQCALKKQDGKEDDGSTIIRLFLMVEVQFVRFDIIKVRERAIEAALNSIKS